MKILLNPTISSSQINFKQNKADRCETKEKNNLGKLTSALLGLSVIGACGVAIYKTNFRKNITSNDRAFYKNIIEGLKKEGINVKMESLQSVVAPDEFKTLIKKYKPEHFKAGLQISEKLAKDVSAEEFFKNAIDGKFRVSLHTHSNFSDGKATIEEFLESATKYADKVARMGKNDDLPPFMIALTDHDGVGGCREIIKIIAKNPEKYKNLKFVSGCEFSVMNGNRHHDITGLVLNPFEENLNKFLDDLANLRKKTVEDFLEKQPIYNGKKISYNDIAEYEKQKYISQGKAGKRCIENCSGLVSVRHGVKFYYEMVGENLDHSIMNQLGNKDIMPIESVINVIKQNGGFASLTHPTKSFWKFMDEEFLVKLVKMGIDGIEVNHQYTPSKITQLGKNNNNIDKADDLFKEISEKYKNFAKTHNLFISGGTDSHEKQVFSREPRITKEVLDKIYN